MNAVHRFADRDGNVVRVRFDETLNVLTTTVRKVDGLFESYYEFTHVVRASITQEA